jgi:hypothetical protein
VPKLANASVMRAGITARYFSLETTNVEFFHKTNRKRAAFRFRIASKGGGTTELEVLIAPNDFAAILKTMCDVDKIATLKAMSRETAKQITSLKG